MKISIGVIPFSDDYSHPADRRKFKYYFDKRNLSFEKANLKVFYDVVYVTIAADLSEWSRYRTRMMRQFGKIPYIIFDLSDGHLSISKFQNFMRPIYYFLTGKFSGLHLSYKKQLLNMMDNSNAVICGSIEQKSILDPYHRNVVVVRDFFDNDILIRKSNYELRRTRELNIVWEGFSHGNIDCFKLAKNICDTIDNFDVHLHIITDLTYCRLGTKTLCSTTYEILKNVFKNSRTKYHLYDWCP